MTELTLPIALPLLLAALTYLLHRERWRRAVAGSGFALHTVWCGALLWHCRDGAIEVTAVGQWLPPHGIVLVADLFSCMVLGAISLVFATTYLYSVGEGVRHPVHRLREPLMFILLSGVSLSIMTADFFNLFVSFEMMLAASYALLVLEVADRHLKWGYAYLLVNLTGTLGFLCGAAMIYGYTGHLNMAALARLLQGEGDNPLIIAWAYLLLGVFGLKAGLFPLYYWLPKVYSVMPSAIGALFAGTLTKVGVYVLARSFIVLLPPAPGEVHSVALAASLLTMLVGVIGALGSATVRGILSYHIVSQIGYMAMGISLYTPLALAAALLFMIHNIWVKVSLFLIGGVAAQSFDSDDLKKMGGLSTAAPALAFCFLLQALALVGLPPLSGFWGKYLLVTASFRQEHYLASGVALFTSWLTLMSMLKIWMGAFWRSGEALMPLPLRPGDSRQYGAIAILICGSVLLGLCAEPLYQKASLATQQIFDRDAYIEAVLRSEGKGIQ